VHARLTDQAAIDAARLGQALAAIVIQHPGAIAPRAAMTSISRT
jgi:sugar/nucleoside kinase (ribokinase family)